MREKCDPFLPILYNELVGCRVGLVVGWIDAGLQHLIILYFLFHKKEKKKRKEKLSLRTWNWGRTNNKPEEARGRPSVGLPQMLSCLSNAELCIIRREHRASYRTAAIPTMANITPRRITPDLRANIAPDHECRETTMRPPLPNHHKRRQTASHRHRETIVCMT